MPLFFNPKCIHSLCPVVTSHSASGFTTWLSLGQRDIGKLVARGAWKACTCLDFLGHILCDSQERDIHILCWPQIVLERGWEWWEAVSNHPNHARWGLLCTASWPPPPRSVKLPSWPPQLHYQCLLVFTSEVLRLFVTQHHSKGQLTSKVKSEW